jgi:hypothetical protein
MGWRCALCLLCNFVAVQASTNVLHTNGEVFDQDIRHNRNMVLFIEPERSAVAFFTMRLLDSINTKKTTGITISLIDNVKDCERNKNIYAYFNTTACESTDLLPLGCIFKNATLAHVFQDEESMGTMGEMVDGIFNL